MDPGRAGQGVETDWEAITESEMKDRLAKSATHNGEATASEVEVDGESACLQRGSPEHESIGLVGKQKTPVKSPNMTTVSKTPDKKVESFVLTPGPGPSAVRRDYTDTVDEPKSTSQSPHS